MAGNIRSFTLIAVFSIWLNVLLPFTQELIASSNACYAWFLILFFIAGQEASTSSVQIGKVRTHVEKIFPATIGSFRVGLLAQMLTVIKFESSSIIFIEF